MSNNRQTSEGSGGNVPLSIESARNIPIDIHTNVDKSSNTFTNSTFYITGTSISGSNETRIERSITGQNQNRNETPNDTSCLVLKQKLQQLYTNITLPKVAWLDEGCDLSMTEYFVKLHLNQSNESIEINDIFNYVNSKKPLRILIEGQPGFGKTTLATKLAHDWARNEKYIKHFELAFLMPLRELQQSRIDDCILQIGSQCDYQRNDHIIELINIHKEETLFILDGLDEVSLEDRLEIMKVLFKQMYSEVTVIVFCRTGLFQFSKKECTKLFGLSNVRRNFYDKQISILGIQGIKKKREFLNKFIPESTVNNVVQCLLYQFDLFDSPLFLMLLPVILEDDENITELSTKTEFYKKLFNSILKHSCVKRGLDIDDHFDLFQFNTSPDQIQEQIRRFGILSVEKIVNKNLKFESNDLTKEIYEYGLLINHKEIKCFKSTNHYEALHLSILEFASAFSFWMDLKLNQAALTENLLNGAINDFIESQGTSLVMPFVASLMEDDLDQLLLQTQSLTAWFSIDFDLTVKLLSECSPSIIHRSKYLTNFISSRINMSEISAYNYIGKYLSVREELVIQGARWGKIKRINCYEETTTKLSRQQINTCLQINFKVIHGVWFTAYSNVPCELEPIFRCRYSIPFRGPLDECLHFAALSNIESCSLEIYTSEAVAGFLRLMTTEKVFDKIRYRYLQIQIVKECQKQVIMKLLEKNQIQSLELIGNCALNMSDLCRVAAQSSYLTCVRFRNVIIDLYDLTNGGTKNYACLDIGFCTLTCRKPLLIRNCCYNLEICGLEDIEAITEMDPGKLECYNIEIDDFIHKFPSWTGFNSVKCLSLHGNYDTNRINLVSVWKNLQTLHLKFEDQPDNEEMIIKCIHNLPITKLVIEKHFQFRISNLFKCMNNMWADNNRSQLTTIDFIDSKLVSSELEVSELIEGLKCNHWDKVNLISTNKELRKMRKTLLNFNVAITYFEYESIFPEFQRLKIYFYTYVSRINNVLSLTRI